MSSNSVGFRNDSGFAKPRNGAGFARAAGNGHRAPIDQDGNRLFEAGFMYPLKDPEKYDDEFVTGYRFAAIDAGADPGVCWMHDCWIVDENGNRHPGMTEYGAPVRRDDLEMDAGRPNPMDPPRASARANATRYLEAREFPMGLVRPR